MSTKYNLPTDAVWFITGTSSGIGKQFIHHLTNTSYRIVATARKLPDLEYIQESPNVLKLKLDLAAPTTIKDAVALAVEKFGRIDVVVNNVGYSLMGDTEIVTDEQARQQFEPNFWGAAELTRQAVRVMRDENPKTGQIGGVISYTSAAGARVAFPGGAYYYATRFAMEGFLESFSKELHPNWNIHITISQPGGVKTGYFQKSVAFTERHPAYSDPACGTNQMYALMQNKDILKSFAGPEKLVEVVVDTFKNGIEGVGIPLRLPLGADGWGLIQDGLEKSLKDHATVKETAFKTSAAGQNMGVLDNLI